MSVTLDRELQRPRWSSQLNGGDREASWERLDRPPYSNLLPPNTPVRVEDLQGAFHLARIDEPGGNFAPQASRLPHLARGYSESARSQVYHNEQVWPAGTRLETIFGETLAKCPLLSGSTELIQYLGRTLEQESPDFMDRPAQDVWAEVQRYGNSLAEPLVWLVRAHPTSGNPTPYLEVKPRPTSPTLFVELADLDAAEISWPLGAVYNRVLVRYKDGDSTALAIADDPVSQSPWPTGIGEIREYPKNVTSRIDNLADAQAYANTLLTQLKTLRPVGAPLSVTWPHQIVDEFGQPAPLWRTTHLVGQVIRIQGLDLDGPYERDQLVVAAQWDDHARRVTLQTEQVGSLMEVWGDLQDEQDNHIEQLVEDATEDLIAEIPEIVGGNLFTSVTDAELPNKINWSTDPTPGADDGKVAREGHSHRITTGRISIPFAHGDGVSDLTTGSKGDPEISFPCEVVGWRLVLVGDGSISLMVTLGASNIPITSSSPDVSIEGLRVPVPAETLMNVTVTAVTDIQQFSLTLRADRKDP